MAATTERAILVSGADAGWTKDCIGEGGTGIETPGAARHAGDFHDGAQLEAETTYDPPSLADGAGVTKTIAVSGAFLGDFAIASFSLDLQGIVLTAYVSSSGVVSVRFQNESTGTIDLASGNLRAIVIRPGNF